MFKMASTALLLAGAMASAQADSPLLINQGFDNVASLGAGWITANNGTPGGTTSWFQGDQTTFTSHSGAPESYIAANYHNVGDGGTLASWLISPTFSTACNVLISFWARGAADPNYFDQLSFGLLDSTGAFSSFTPQATVTVSQDGWTEYSMYVSAAVVGTSARFGIEYVGSGDTANYVGVDDLQVHAVPEPSSWLLVGISMLGLAAASTRRRSQQR